MEFGDWQGTVALSLWALWAPWLSPHGHCGHHSSLPVGTAALCPGHRGSLPMGTVALSPWAPWLTPHGHYGHCGSLPLAPWLSPHGHRSSLPMGTVVLCPEHRSSLPVGTMGTVALSLWALWTPQLSPHGHCGHHGSLPVGTAALSLWVLWAPRLSPHGHRSSLPVSTAALCPWVCGSLPVGTMGTTALLLCLSEPSSGTAGPSGTLVRLPVSLQSHVHPSVTEHSPTSFLLALVKMTVSTLFPQGQFPETHHVSTHPGAYSSQSPLSGSSFLGDGVAGR